MSAPSKTKTSLISCLNYRDADAAISWLVQAFGFEEHAVYRDDAGRAVHAELTFGNGMIMLGPYGKGEFGKRFMTLPELADSRCTQSIYVIVDDADAHHARATAAGAEIIMPLEDASYGGRGYSARDPEGRRVEKGTLSNGLF